MFVTLNADPRHHQRLRAVLRLWWFSMDRRTLQLRPCVLPSPIRSCQTVRLNADRRNYRHFGEVLVAALYQRQKRL